MMKKIPLTLIPVLNIKYVLLSSIIVGILSILTTPPFNIYIIEFFLFIPICYIYHSSYQKLSSRFVFFYTFLTGWVIMLCQSSWITYTMIQFGDIPTWVAYSIFIVYAAYIAIKFGLIFTIPFVLKKYYGYPIFVSLMVSCFFIEMFFPEIFPFYIGNAQLYHSYFVQIADIIGVQGISILVLLVNYLLFCFFSSGTKKYLIFISIIFFTTYSYSILRYLEIQSYKKTGKDINELTIALVQPNIPFSVLSIENQTRFKNKLIDNTNYMIKKNNNIDLIVWPESAIPYSLDSTKTGQELMSYIQNLNIPIIYNAAHTESSGKIYSSAIFHLADKTAPVSYYNKNMLLPFGEYLPTDSFYPELHKYFPEIGDFSRGEDIVNFTLKPNIILAPQICYEIILPYYTRQFIKKGANIIINMTNDSWFGDSRAAKLHLWAASFRAIENRVPIVRATNTGISTIIGIKGWAIAPKTQLFTETTLIATVPIFFKIKSLYAYMGNWTLGLFLSYLFIRIWFSHYMTKRPWIIQVMMQRFGKL